MRPFTEIHRNSDNSPLTLPQLRKACPAVFARSAEEGVSKRYGFIDSKEVLDTILAEGLQPVEARSFMRKRPGAMVHTAHMLKFRPDMPIEKLQVGDVVPEVVLLSSHDRSVAFQMFGGLFRLVCTNGLLVSAGRHVEPIKMRHYASVVDGVQDAVKAVAKQHAKVFAHVDAMRTTQLTPRKQLAFATKALELKAPSAGTIDAGALLIARRPEDDGASVWSTYNRVQENLIKGGLVGVTATGRATRTTGVTSIATDVAINSALWNLAIDATL